MKLLALAPLLTALPLLAAQDDRLGWVTHFDNQVAHPQYNPNHIIPVMHRTPARYIRDDINWKGMEKRPGVFALDPVKQPWMYAMSAAGYQIVADLGFDPEGNYTPSFYTQSPYPTKQAAAFLAWFVKTEAARGVHIACIEVINEPNNNFQTVEGANWEAQLVNLSNAVADAVHATGVPTKVIGLGAQGKQILDMLALTPTHLDGIVYHPYDLNDGTPEHTYEPPYTDYVTWVKALQAATSIPIWETECADDAEGAGTGEYHSAMWDVRRLTLATNLGVAHTFFYQFADSNNSQSVTSYTRKPRMAMYAINRFYDLLSGLTVSGTASFTSSERTFDFVNTQGHTFKNTDSSRVVCIAWTGNSNPVGPSLTKTLIATVGFPDSVAPKGITVVNMVTGDPVPFTGFTYSGGNVMVSGVPIGYAPVAIMTASTGLARQQIRRALGRPRITGD